MYSLSLCTCRGIVVRQRRRRSRRCPLPRPSQTTDCRLEVQEPPPVGPAVGTASHSSASPHRYRPGHMGANRRSSHRPPRLRPGRTVGPRCRPRAWCAMSTIAVPHSRRSPNGAKSSAANWCRWVPVAGRSGGPSGTGRRRRGHYGRHNAGRSISAARRWCQRCSNGCHRSSARRRYSAVDSTTQRSTAPASFTAHCFIVGREFADRGIVMAADRPGNASGGGAMPRLAPTPPIGSMLA